VLRHKQRITAPPLWALQAISRNIATASVTGEDRTCPGLACRCATSAEQWHAVAGSCTRRVPPAALAILLPHPLSAHASYDRCPHPPPAVSAIACAANGGNATASANGTAQATAVAEAATLTYAAAFASLASCLAPPPPAGGTALPVALSRQSLQCIILPNTNLDGDVVQSTTAPTADACCNLCKQKQVCGGAAASWRC